MARSVLQHLADMRSLLVALPLTLALACSPASGGDFEGGGSIAKSGDGPVGWSPDGEQTPEGEPEPGTPPGTEPTDPGDPVDPGTVPEPEPEPPVQDPPGDPSTNPPDDPPPAGCTYPGGPYGNTPGAIANPNFSWQGFTPGSQAASTFGSQDLFDCDGSRGIHAILITYAAGWCSACQDEAGQLPQKMATWGPAGIVVVELVIETSSGYPADITMAQQWRDIFGLYDVYVGADPDFAFDSQYADALPFKLIVNPRDMTIVRAYTGDTYDHEVLQLAQSNH